MILLKQKKEKEKKMKAILEQGNGKSISWSFLVFTLS